MTKSVEMKLADCHVHVWGLDGYDDLVQVIKAAGLHSATVLSVAMEGDVTLDQNCVGLLAKALHPGKVYSFGCLWHPRSGTVPHPLSYEAQARSLIETGCDGMKMLEGKPTERQALQEPLDSPDYDSYYTYLEAADIPVLYHVADPETFWDPNAPKEIREGPWFYGGGGYPSQEQIYQEMEHVLQQHPGLRVVFAHFYFLSAEPTRAAAFLDRYPNVNLDLTPGNEMYFNFSRDPGRWREFFIAYQDRIFFGTDNMFGSGVWEMDWQECVAKIRAMRTFLGTDRTFEWMGGRQHGLHLPPEVLAKIYFRNFDRFVGGPPKPVNLGRVTELCQRTLQMARSSSQPERLVPALETMERKLSELPRAGAD